jgi:hypothetical protein
VNDDTTSQRLIEIVESVRRIPYGRPSDRSVAGMLRENLGTCSTKHLYLADRLRREAPETRPRIVHRVSRVTREDAAARWGTVVAGVVPSEGLVDVHRYLTIEVDGCRIAVDATFPGPSWDGVSPMALACGPGLDEPAGEDPDADKRRLEREHCDPAVREPFIAALARAGQPVCASGSSTGSRSSAST